MADRFLEDVRFGIPSLYHTKICGSREKQRARDSQRDASATLAKLGRGQQGRLSLHDFVGDGEDFGYDFRDITFSGPVIDQAGAQTEVPPQSCIREINPAALDQSLQDA
jgi:hypothetical protein